jgi:hypothetical protein
MLRSCPNGNFLSDLLFLSTRFEGHFWQNPSPEFNEDETKYIAVYISTPPFSGAALGQHL